MLEPWTDDAPACVDVMVVYVRLLTAIMECLLLMDGGLSLRREYGL